MGNRVAAHLRQNVYGLVAVFIALSGTAYAANEWTGENIVDESLTGADIGNSSLNGGELSPATLGPREIIGDSLATGQIKNESLTGDDLRNASLNGGELSPATLGPREIIGESLGRNQIATGGVGSLEVLDQSLFGQDIGENAISSDEIAADGVNGSDVAANTLTTADIAEDTLAVPRSYVANRDVSIAVAHNGATGVVTKPVNNAGRYVVMATLAGFLSQNAADDAEILTCSLTRTDTGAKLATKQVVVEKSDDLGPDLLAQQTESLTLIAASSIGSSGSYGVVCGGSSSGITVKAPSIAAIKVGTIQ